MKNILTYILIALTFVFLHNCEDDDIIEDFNYVTFESGPISFSVTGDSTESFDVTVYSADVSGSDRSFEVSVSDASTLASPFSVPSSVTIPANSNEGTLTISITDDNNLQFVAQTLVLNFVDGTGVDIGNDLTINVTEKCLDTIVNLAIATDNWPDETTWELYNLDDITNPVLLQQGGPFNNPADDFVTINVQFCLTSGDYGVVVRDAYGDGGPTINVTTGDGTVLVPATTVTGFGSSATFTID